MKRIIDKNILSFLRSVSFFFVFYILAIQPIVTLIILTLDTNNELVLVKVEKDSLKKENQDSEEKEEIEKLNYFISSSSEFLLKDYAIILFKFNEFREVSLRIDIIPPENV